MARKIFQHVRGDKSNLPKLAPGEIAKTTDTNSEEVYIGGETENIRLLDQKDKGELTAQLAETSQKTKETFSKNNTNRIPTLNLSTKRIPKALASLVDDDNAIEIMDKLFPLSVKHNVPFTLGLIGDYVEKGIGISTENILKVQNEHGWEIASHSYNHFGMDGAGVTDAQKEYEIRYSLEYLRSKGFDVKNFVYPGGQTGGEYGLNLISQYYNAGVGTDNYVNKMPLATYNLARINFPQSDGNNNLAWYKEKVDEAIANNGWIIFMTHCGVETFDTIQIQMLDDLIAYIKSVNVEFVTIQKGLDLLGNVLDINNRELFISADGTNNILNYTHVDYDSVTGREKINADMKPSEYEDNKTFVAQIINTTEINKFPSKIRGNFKVVRAGNNTFRTYIDADNNEFTSFARLNDTWGTWKQKIKTTGMKTTSISVTIPANDYKSTFIEYGLYTQLKMALLKPEITLPPGITFSYYVDGLNGMIRVIFQNLTTNPVTLTDTKWNYILVDVFPF